MSEKIGIDQSLGKAASDRFRQFRLDIRQAQPIVGRSAQGFVDNRVRSDLHTEQTRCRFGDCYCPAFAVAFVRHRGGRSYTDRRGVRRATIAQPSDQDSDIGALPASIGMQLVENDELETVGVRYHLTIDAVLTGQQQLGHHEVGQENVGRIVSDPLSCFLDPPDPCNAGQPASTAPAGLTAR